MVLARAVSLVVGELGFAGCLTVCFSKVDFPEMVGWAVDGFVWRFNCDNSGLCRGTVCDFVF